MNTAEVLDVIRTRVPPATTFVASLGRTSEETFRRWPTSTLFIDSLGDVTTLAVGVALGLGHAHPVVALDTDGSHLFGLPALPTLSQLAAGLPNLMVVVLDNGIYESGGGLPSRDCSLDWELLGRAFGLPLRRVTSTPGLVDALRHAFKTFIYLVAEVNNSDALVPVEKTLDGIESKYQFVRHLESISGRQILRPALKA